LVVWHIVSYATIFKIGISLAYYQTLAELIFLKSNSIMETKTQIIKYRQSFINVYFFGEGDKYLFCFHGYGEDGRSFEFLKNFLGNEYTLIAMDLPFHGKTTWNEGLLMSPQDLINILDLITSSKGTENKISLLGFSLGGRIALHLLQTIPSLIEKVVLIAPDGLHVNFWYSLGTQTIIGNKLFAYTMKKPGWFAKLVNFGNKIKLLSSSIVRFTHYYLDDEQERFLLYQRWTTMRKFKPNVYLVRKAIEKYKINVRVLFGSYDRIILSKRSSFFKNDPHVKIKVIEAGHMLLSKKYAEDIASLFSQ
jgi:pimeloyl-ACP methyl ester carboxylesterase